jgi:dihydrolipoamide dehydrogenase
MVMGEFTQETEVLVIGGGPGGYAAAFRAADLGLQVTMVDMEPRAGGVCLFRGCIPSKTLLYVSELLHDAKSAEKMGVDFNEPRVDLIRLREWKDQVVDRLAKGLVQLSKKRKVEYIQARAGFEDSHHVRLYDSESEVSHISFKHAIIATGSRPIALPGSEFKPGGRIMDSSSALKLEELPEKLLVVGGGYVGVELGSVYASLGSRVTLVEITDQLMPGTDRDLLKPLFERLQDLFADIYLNTKV